MCLTGIYVYIYLSITPPCCLQSPQTPRRNVCHRDLKLENILFLRRSLDSPIRVADFGLSKQCPDPHTSRNKQTVWRLEGKRWNIKNRHHDFFSIGSIGWWRIGWLVIKPKSLTFAPISGKTLLSSFFSPSN